MGTVGDLNAMLEDLELLVNTESPSHDAARLAESAQAIASIIERRLGTAATLLESAAGPHVHWSGGGTPRVLLLGHHDTVFPVGSCAARPFAVADGRATGPGVASQMESASTTLLRLSTVRTPLRNSLELIWARWQCRKRSIKMATATALIARSNHSTGPPFDNNTGNVSMGPYIRSKSRRSKAKVYSLPPVADEVTSR